MTEPVAYLNKYLDNSTNITRHDISDGSLILASNTKVSSTPLYTAEQLHPRVKMTQTEFDEWKELYHHLIALSLGVHRVLDEILCSSSKAWGKYTKLAKRVYKDDDFMSVSKKQAELTNLFINYSPDKPEETIEIVPDMKWFVRSKTKENGHYKVLAESRYSLMPRYTIFKSYAMTFDTKEQAEKWTKPLTEAVQLPVEDE